MVEIFAVAFVFFFIAISALMLTAAAIVHFAKKLTGENNRRG